MARSKTETKAPEQNLVECGQYLQFLNAIVASSDSDRAEEAFRRARDSEPDTVASAVRQITAIGELSSLRNYLKTKPSRMMVLTELTRKLFVEDDIEEVIDEVMSINTEEEDEGDFYYDQGEDSGGC